MNEVLDARVAECVMDGGMAAAILACLGIHSLIKFLEKEAIQPRFFLLFEQ